MLGSSSRRTDREGTVPGFLDGGGTLSMKSVQPSRYYQQSVFVVEKFNTRGAFAEEQRTSSTDHDTYWLENQDASAKLLSDQLGGRTELYRILDHR